jgi:hypothetical protein
MFKIIIFAIFLFINQSYSQESLLENADEVLSGDSFQMDDINLTDGCNPSPYISGCGSGKLKLRREKLVERNKVIVEKKIEDIRVKQEIALTNKLQDAFGKSMNNPKDDKVKPDPIINPIITAAQSTEIPSEELLKDIKKELAIKFKPEERVDTVQLMDQRLLYSITLLKIPNAEKMLPPSTIESSNEFMRDKYCSQSATSKIRIKDISIVNSYKAINGDLLYEVNINPSDCQNSKKN